MELIALTQALWRRRLVIAVGIVLAIAVGMKLASGPSSRIGVAATRVMLDTPDSQLVNQDTLGSETLPWRASLLAELMATPTARNRIAHDVGIPVRSLRVATPAPVAPATPTPLSDFALQASEAAPSPYLLTIGTPADASASGAQLPIVTVSAQAPTPLEATRLTAAAVSALEATAPPPAGFGNHDQPITAEQTAPIRTGAVVTGSPRRTAAMAAVFVLGLWCCAALGVSALVRRLRRRAPVGASAV